MREPASAEGVRQDAGMARFLDAIERAGNRLPDPALLFFVLLIVVWLLSALLSQLDYDHVDPRSGNPVEVRNLLTGEALTSFFAGMVKTFVGFHPLGVVLVARGSSKLPPMVSYTSISAVEPSKPPCAVSQRCPEAVSSP